MVFTGPAFVDIPCLHALVSPLHAEGTDVDVPHEHHHHQHGRHGMHHVGHLHVATGVGHARNDLVHHQARGHDDQAQHKHPAPEDEFFTGIEPVRRHFLRAEQATTSGQPSQVSLLRNVVAHKGHQNHQQRDGKQRAGKVVRGFQRIGQPAEQGGADHWQQKKLPEGHHQPGDGEHAERNGVAPVGCTLEVGEAFDQPPRVGHMPTQGPLAPIEHRNGKRHDQQQCAAVGNDQLVAHLPPSLAGVGQLGPGILDKGLDQRARFGGGEAAAALHMARLSHRAPERRVVARLALGTLGVGFIGLGFGRRAEPGRWCGVARTILGEGSARQRQHRQSRHGSASDHASHVVCPLAAHLVLA